MSNLYIRITRPEGYEDIHPDLILQDMSIDHVWGAEVVDVEAVLRECREALVLTQDGSEFAACLPDEWSFAADKDWNQMKEAIAKIDEGLHRDP